MGSGSLDPVRATHELVGLALEVSDDSEALPMSRFGLERPSDFLTAAFHHCVRFASEKVGPTGVRLPSMLSRQDSVWMVMICFAIRCDFICSDLILKAYMFALCHFDVICGVYRAELRDMCINVVATVFEKCSGTNPWSLQLSMRISFIAPAVKDCEVNAIDIGTSRKSH